MPSKRQNPLRPKSRELLNAFCESATNRWTGMKDRSLHPRDRLKFLVFIDWTHGHQQTVTPEDVHGQLIAAGFPARIANALEEVYRIGRQALACHLHPWSKRKHKAAQKPTRGDPIGADGPFPFDEVWKNVTLVPPRPQRPLPEEGGGRIIRMGPRHK
jgi:hypothetical protein